MHLKIALRIFLLLLFTGTISQQSVFAQSETLQLIVIGTPDDIDGLNSEEKNAYNWAISNFDSEYLSFDDLAGSELILSDYDVVWWHYDDTFDSEYSLPAEAKIDNTLNALNTFVTEGGGLFLSGFAPQLVVDLGIQTAPPNEITRDEKTSEAWGFYQMESGHPVFDGLQNPFATLSSGLAVDNTICWWTDPADFEGTWLTDLEWRSPTGPNIVSSGEYKHGKGKVIFVGAGAFEWDYDGENRNRNNLELFAHNIISYLRPVSKLNIAYLVEDKNNVTGDVAVALTWLQENYLTDVMNFAEVGESGFPDNTDIIWWHHSSSTEMPDAALKSDVVGEIKVNVFNGTGLKLSGFATQYVETLGLADAPDVVERYDMSPPATNVDVVFSRHDIFNTLPSSFQIRSGDSGLNYDSYWSDATAFPGNRLASDNKSEDNVAIGSLRYGSGRILVVGTGAYNWSESFETQYFSDFERLLNNSFNYLGTEAPKVVDGLIVHFPLNGSEGQNMTKEEVTDKNAAVANNYNSPEWVPSPKGTGLRLDGYTTWINWNESVEQLSADEITVELFAALEVYPPANAAFVNNYRYPDKGYYLGIDPHGAWYFAISIDGNWHTVWGDGRFPKREWSHIAGVFSKEEGLKLYRNGELVGTQDTPNQPFTPDFDNPVTIGKDIHTEKIAAFPTGVLNGIVDDVKIYNKAKTEQQIKSSFQSGDMSVPVDLKVPDSRYEDDPHRPDFHPMPPAHWANEPHGLTYHDGRYHLFYQYNPSGPYWSHIHWGHISSKNLYDWEDHPIPLAPEPGYDSYGVWSGDALVHDGKIHTFYTAVDGARAGVSLAVMNDYGDFEKHPQNPLFYLPPGNYLDFRDPFVWKHSDGWYLTIGTGVPEGGGGVSLLYWSADLVNWEFRGELFGEGDPSESGHYWEMPVFTHLKDGKHFFGVTHLPIGRNDYWIGEWENEKFVPDHEKPVRLDLINRFLSPTIEHTPDGRILAIGIIPNHISSEFASELGWEHVFSFPREWYYNEEDNTLGQRPAEELKQMRGTHHKSGPISLSDSRGNALNWRSKSFEMIAEFELSTATKAGVELRATDSGDEITRIYYDKERSQIVVDLSKASNNGSTVRDVRTGAFELKDGEKLKLHVFVDKSVIEVFVNDTKALATRVFPTSLDSDNMNVFASGGSAFIYNVDMWELDKNATSTEDLLENTTSVPDNIELKQNYPNPFNPSTNISFGIPSATDVRIDVFNILGRHIKTLVQRKMQAGNHEVSFNAASLPSGMYFYRLTAGDVVKTEKMILLK